MLLGNRFSKENAEEASKCGEGSMQPEHALKHPLCTSSSYVVNLKDLYIPDPKAVNSLKKRNIRKAHEAI